MERIISKVSRLEPEAALRQRDEYIKSLKGLPIAEAEDKIAEDRFRKPIVIFDGWAIRPFWRDWRRAPSLFPKKTFKGVKAEKYIVG